MRLIDADALVDAIKDKIAVDKEIYPDDEFFRFSRFGMRTVIGIVKNQDTVDPVKHGHWITVSPNYSEPDDWYCECSLCGCAETDTTQFLPNYCPKCGAKMDGDKDAID